MNPDNLAKHERNVFDALVRIANQSQAMREWGQSQSPEPPGPMPTNPHAKTDESLLMVHISEAGRRTKIPAVTLRKWCAERSIMAEKRGRDWYVDLDDAEFWHETTRERASKSQAERRAREAQHG